MTDENNPSPPGPPPATPPPPAGAAPPPPGAPPPHNPPSGGGAVSENRGIFMVLAYLWPLALIPFLLEKNDQEVQWHSKHGLVILAAEIVMWIALTVVNIVITAVIPFVGCFSAIAFLVLGLFLLVFHIYLIVKAIDGKRILIPGVSPFADQF